MTLTMTYYLLLPSLLSRDYAFLLLLVRDGSSVLQRFVCG